MPVFTLSSTSKRAPAGIGARSHRGFGPTGSAGAAAVLASANEYLRIAGPAFMFFGFGHGLYFASQGSGKILGPVLAGTRILARVSYAAMHELARFGSESSGNTSRRNAVMLAKLVFTLSV